MSETLGEIQISPREVQQMRARGEDFLLVDVREPWEHDAARIENSLLIPLREIPGNVSRLAGAGPIVLYCHHGIRSLDAAEWLRAQGIGGAKSMAGGIERWSVEVDSNVPRY
jgi:adenylyltransferase/sulfurtransferase